MDWSESEDCHIRSVVVEMEQPDVVNDRAGAAEVPGPAWSVGWRLHYALVCTPAGFEPLGAYGR